MEVETALVHVTIIVIVVVIHVKVVVLTDVTMVVMGVRDNLNRLYI